MVVSVVVSTYNGAPFIMEQLESIRTQERQPDEVIICDDGSKDDTVSRISDFIHQNSLDNWVLQKNEENKGWKRNFFDLFEKASGEIVFPCDQDDIWHPDKIKIMEKIMEERPEISVLEGQPHRWLCSTETNKKTMRQRLISWLDYIEARNERSGNSGKVSRMSFNRQFLHVWPGCVLCFRREYFQSIRELWFEEIPHDAFLSIHAKVDKSYYRLDCDVIEWRRYNSSSTQAVAKSRENRLYEIHRDRKIIDNATDYAGKCKNSAALKYCHKAEKWNQNREKMVLNGSVKAFFKLLPLLFYYTQKRRFLSDVYYGFKRKNNENK